MPAADAAAALGDAALLAAAAEAGLDAGELGRLAAYGGAGGP
jgi:hypothetical protein